MPFRSGIVGCQPSLRILVTSKSLRGVPSGFVLSQTSLPSKPTTSQTNSASSRMVTSSPQPMLMISGESYFSSNKRQAAARSSTCKNLRRGFRVNAGASEKEQLAHAALVGGANNVVLNAQILEQKVHRIIIVCLYPSDFCRRENHDVRALFQKELQNRILFHKIELKSL